MYFTSKYVFLVYVFPGILEKNDSSPNNCSFKTSVSADSNKIETGPPFLYNYLVEQKIYYSPIEVEAEHARITKLIDRSSVVGLARLVHCQKKTGTILL